MSETESVLVPYTEQLENLCKLGRSLASLSPKNQAVINEALFGSEVDFPSRHLCSVLHSVDIDVWTDTIIKHRRQHCRCFRSQETVNG